MHPSGNTMCCIAIYNSYIHKNIVRYIKNNIGYMYISFKK